MGARSVIVWLASYPRSGNTLLRMVLRHCFGLESYSLYGDQEFTSQTVRDMVGERPVGSDAHGFVRKLQQEGRAAFVKTHELPGNDTHRTLYIVRDGRAALVSHYHYFRNVLGLHVALEDLISGALFSSWSQHVASWMLSGRPNVLPIHYEALSRGEPAVLDSLAAFLGTPCSQPFSVSFSTLQDLMPSFFRSGSNGRNIAEMTDIQLDLFEKLHGKVWRAIGYAPGSATKASAARSINHVHQK